MVIIPAWLFNALTYAIVYGLFVGVLHLFGYRLIVRIERRDAPTDRDWRDPH